MLPGQGHPLLEEAEQPEPGVDGRGAARGEGKEPPAHGPGGGDEGAEVHLEPDEEEEHAVDAEGGHLPDRADRHLARGRERFPSRPAQRQTGGDHGEHGRGVERLREKRRAVGGDRGEHDLHQVVLGAPHQVGDGIAEAEPAPQPHRRDPGQAGEAVGGIEASVLDRGQDGGESHDGGAVVQEALVLHDGRQSRRDPNLAEARDDGDGVGGGQGGAEEQSDRPLEVEAGVQDRSGHEDRGQHPGDGQHRDRDEVLAEPAKVRGEGRFVQENGQEDLEHDLGLQTDPRYGLGGAEHDPGQDEGDVVVDADPLGQEADRRRDEQQQQHDRQRAVQHYPNAARSASRWKSPSTLLALLIGNGLALE